MLPTSDVADSPCEMPGGNGEPSCEIELGSVPEQQAWRAGRRPVITILAVRGD